MPSHIFSEFMRLSCLGTAGSNAKKVRVQAPPCSALRCLALPCAALRCCLAMHCAVVHAAVCCSCRLQALLQECWNHMSTPADLL